MKKADIVLIVAIMLLSLASILFVFSHNTTGTVAVVKIRNEEVMRIDLTRDGSYTVQGTNGEVYIEVKDGAIAVTQETSAHHYCSLQGYVSSPNTPVVCLPNETVITIEGTDESEDTLIS